LRFIFPDMVFGSESTNSIAHGYLYGAVIFSHGSGSHG
jgi:hypothetical protein